MPLGERLAGDEAGEAEGGDGGLGAAREHDVGRAVRNVDEGVAHGVGGRCAGGDHGGVRPAEAELDADDAAGGVSHHLRDEEGADAVRAALEEDGLLLLDLLESADAAADYAAGAVEVLL
jgi:hypothetical protein